MPCGCRMTLARRTHVRCTEATNSSPGSRQTWIPRKLLAFLLCFFQMCWCTPVRTSISGEYDHKIQDTASVMHFQSGEQSEYAVCSMLESGQTAQRKISRLRRKCEMRFIFVQQLTFSANLCMHASSPLIAHVILDSHYPSKSLYDAHTSFVCK